MYKRFISLFVICLLPFSSLLSQKFTGKEPANKLAILEMFTGVRDSYTPRADAEANSVMQKYGNKVMVINYQPSNYSYSEPYGGYESLKRDWPSAFFTESFAGNVDMKSMAFINRRIKNGKRMQLRDYWPSSTMEIIKEASPCNVGFRGTYNPEDSTLAVDLEVYFTSNVTDKYYIYAVLLQDSVVSMQATFDGEKEDYAHNKVFREALTDCWGDPITETTSKGSLIARKYVFDNSEKNYKIEKCSIVVFIRNSADEEIITGAGGKAHSDRLLIDNPDVYDCIGSGAGSEKVISLRNNGEKKITLQMALAKSARTPSDWNVDMVLPNKAFKNPDKPQAANLSLEPGESADITARVTAGTTLGVGDAEINITSPDLYNENKRIRLTAVSDNVEFLEILNKAYANEPYSINQILKAAGKDEFVKLEPQGICSLYDKLNRLKIVAWSFNPADTLKEAYADAIYNILKKDIRMIITGCFPLTSLYTVYAGHPLYNLIGMTINEAKDYTCQLNTLTFASDQTDKNFRGLNLGWKMNEKTDSLIQPLLIKKPNIATPILKIKDKNFVVAAKAAPGNSRIVILHFNPYSLTATADRKALFEKCFKWLESTNPAGPFIAPNYTDLDYGNVNAGKYIDTVIEISNAGDENLKLYKLEFTGADKDRFRVHLGGIADTTVVEPGDKRLVTLRFAVASNLIKSRDFLADFAIYSNASGDTAVKIPCRGYGISSNDVYDLPAAELNIEILPNPANSNPVIKFTNSYGNTINIEAALTDINGNTVQNVFNGTLGQGISTIGINTGGFASGIYYLMVKSKFGNQYKKLVFEK